MKGHYEKKLPNLKRDLSKIPYNVSREQVSSEYFFVSSQEFASFCGASRAVGLKLIVLLLDLDDVHASEFKQAWGSIGDSIVVVGGDGLYNCHIHTNDIGAAIEAPLLLGGRPKQIRVTDLFEEVSEESALTTRPVHRRDGAKRRRTGREEGCDPFIKRR